MFILLCCVPGCRLLLPFLLPFGGTAIYNAVCLLPPSAASLFAFGLLKWERRMQGLTLETLWLPTTQNSEFSAGNAMLMLAVDVLIFAALTWWGDKVGEAPDENSSRMMSTVTCWLAAGASSQVHCI
jgi:hypothetical protein